MRFRARVGVTLAGIVTGTAVTTVVAVLALRSVFVASDRVTSAYSDDVEVLANIRNAAEREASSSRAYLIGGDMAFLQRVRAAAGELRASVEILRGGSSSSENRRLIDEIAAANEEYEQALEQVTAGGRAGRDAMSTRHVFDEQTRPAKEQLTRAIAELAHREQEQLIDAERSARHTRSVALALVMGVGALSVMMAAVFAIALVRSWRRAAEQQEKLGAVLERLEQSNVDLEAFAARVAHDVRNALAPLAITAGVLQRPNLPDALVRKTATAISRTVDRTRALVEALLAFSRAERLVDPFEQASLRATAVAVVDELEPLVVQSDAHVEVDVHDVEVRCPRALLNVIVANLVGNAVKFLRDRPERVVRLTSGLARGGCELRVEDTGPGIPEELRERIFEPFFRVPGAAAPGTGIGLATVRRIVDAHGGRVSVEGRAGGGSSFRVWLPLASVERRSTTPVDQPARAEATMPH